MLIRPVLHLLLHVAAPAAAARLLFADRWKSAWIVMTLTLAVDLDHLIADPVYDPNRCSIGFHPLHGPAAMAVYAAMLLFPKTRIVGVGLLLHMVLDGADCLTMSI